MQKKPLNIVVKDAYEAAKRLNEIVDQGGYHFDFGISNEYITTVTKRSDGSRSEVREKRFRLTGMVDTYVGEELEPLNAVREDMRQVEKEREEMNRTLSIMNKSPFAIGSIFFMIVALITLVLGILTLAKVLPIPNGQIPIAISLVVVGVLSAGLSFLLFFFRRKKKLELLTRKDEILKEDEDLRVREKDVDARIPAWYKEARWTAMGDYFSNETQRHELRK